MSSVIAADVTDTIGVGADHRTTRTELKIVKKHKASKRVHAEKVAKGWSPINPDAYRHKVAEFLSEAKAKKRCR